MKSLEIYFFLVFVINLTLGLSVFFTNWKRVINQHYLTLCFFTTAWLIATWLALQTMLGAHALLSIQSTSAIAIFIPAACHLLRRAILYPDESWLQNIINIRVQILFCLLIAGLCFSPFFITSVQMPTESVSSNIPEPKYSWGILVFTGYFIFQIGTLLALFPKDRKKIFAARRVELEFITFGYVLALLIGSVAGPGLTFLRGSSATMPWTNVSSILVLTIVISYGIATKRILDIASIFRKVIAYSLLGTYLTGLYLLIWWSASKLFLSFGLSLPLVIQVLAAVTTAFAMAPANGKLQRFTNKLISSKAMDVPAIMKKAGRIFQSMSTVNDLLHYFAQLLLETLGSERIEILFLKDGEFKQSYPNDSIEQPTLVTADDALTRLLSKEGEPISLDSLVRGRQTPLTEAATEKLKKLNATVAIGIFSKSKITGMVLFGTRLNGRIYDKTEQDALQILCNQFAVALENAHLYTEMQDSKIRNEMLLDQLVSGVIVASPDRNITLINHEAQRITKLTEAQAIGQGIDLLPEALFQALEATLNTKSGLRTGNAALFAQEEVSTHVRMGSAHIIGHDGKPMGALLVFTDMTELKKLEEQVRRTDQLSSVGTLAAGMAHEIKNPLVTIKTFAHLLPERHSDEEFRQEFSSLVTHEVSRIDGIVNQLLSFSKPTQPHLVPMKLHDTVEHTLKLINEQLSQKHIELHSNLQAQQDLISGDADLLTQALVNLNLNAIDAIENGGTIRIGTTNCSFNFAQGDQPDKAVKKACVRLQITDTGVGIKEENLHKIFDPFFTSKSEGTGMGLSVSHGIIQEHHGVIDVESNPGKGSTFSIYFPILKENPSA